VGTCSGRQLRQGRGGRLRLAGRTCASRRHPSPGGRWLL